MSASTILSIRSIVFLLFAFAMVATHLGGHRRGAGGQGGGAHGSHEGCGGGGQAHSQRTNEAGRPEEAACPSVLPITSRDGEHHHAARGGA